ncbi:MAG: hypothetical protein OCC46_09785 [Pseudodesulfovibrio sp.]
MSDEGQRIEFGKEGPYLLQLLDVEPQALLLEEHDVCLLQFGQLYMPVSLDACKRMADSLTNMSQAGMGPERAGMIPVEFDLEETTELPLISSAAGESFQFNETIYMDVQFGDAAARLCFSLQTAATVRQIMAQAPTE